MAKREIDKPNRNHNKIKERKENTIVEKKADTNGNFDFNNLDMNSIASLLNNVDLGKVMSMFNGMGNGMGNGNGNTANNSQEEINISRKSVDERNKKLELLNAMKPLFNAERSQILDAIMHLYAISKILK